MAQAQAPVAGWAEHEDRFQVSKGTTVSFNARGSVLRLGTAPNAQEEQKFVDFYNKAVFPRVTERDNRLSPNQECNPHPAEGSRNDVQSAGTGRL